MTEGAAYLPPAAEPFGEGPTIELARFECSDTISGYYRYLRFHAQFGDPHVKPTPYSYALPYPAGLTFSVIQGFHGKFSHRGSNEYAVDFDCPIGTPVLATRPGVVVAGNAAAQKAGLTPEYLDYKRVNFLLVLHDDGSLGEYLHLAPGSIRVRAGQRVDRCQVLALSGNTGFSSHPHLHFQVMTAAEDGLSARSFPISGASGKRVGHPLTAGCSSRPPRWK